MATGNKAFRSLMKKYKVIYTKLERQNKIPFCENIFHEHGLLDPPGKFLQRDETGQWKPLPKERALLKISQALRDKPTQERREEKPKVVKKENTKETSHAHMEHLNSTPNLIQVTPLYLPMPCYVQQFLSAPLLSDAHHRISTALASSAIEHHNTTEFQGPFMQRHMTRGPFVFHGSYGNHVIPGKYYAFLS